MILTPLEKKMTHLTSKLNIKSPYLRVKPEQRFNHSEQYLIRTSYQLTPEIKNKLNRVWNEEMTSSTFRQFYNLRICDGVFKGTGVDSDFIVEWANHPTHCFKHCEVVELSWREAPKNSNLNNYVVIFAKR